MKTDSAVPAELASAPAAVVKETSLEVGHDLIHLERLIRHLERQQDSAEACEENHRALGRLEEVKKFLTDRDARKTAHNV